MLVIFYEMDNKTVIQNDSNIFTYCELSYTMNKNL